MNYFKYELCDYRSDEVNTLNKQINLKHTKQKCKEFKTSMKLVNRVAKEHHDQEEAWNVQFQSTQ